ncbi:hypothetical protein [Deminuibacter soli]|uniref:DUF4175 family protein n=1 Tax=Deminuibacter soli TaxID=2291815 RepID=A0A3E1NQL7_9BACT|nr:hypothetical protein [Deminuibacter soli]RFM30197.1 hypothetical protein DXN05_04290 [Deminuibacter soli]
MQQSNPHPIINRLRKTWRMQALRLYVTTALATAVIAGVVLHLGHISWYWGIVAGIAMLATLLPGSQAWRLRDEDVVRYLNAHYAEMEQSTQLLLLPQHDLNLLQQLQVCKLQTAVVDLPELKPFLSRQKKATWLLLCAMVMAALSVLLPLHKAGSNGQPKANSSEPVRMPVAGTQSLQIIITPPAYLELPARKQQQPDILAEAGAHVQWNLQTTEKATAVQLLFNDSTVLTLQATDTARRQWTGGKTLIQPGFYQVVLNKTAGGLNKIEIKQDQPPAIQVQAPKPYTVIDYGMPRSAHVQAAITDDYGVQQAFIVATIASGNGEAVKFKEQRIPFATAFTGHLPLYTVEKTLDLAQLGMHPGDELYFYIQATDVHAQQTRSDVLIVSLPDTAQLMSMDGIVNGVNLKPEYFRSERQIILDAEQLLREKDTLAAETFKNRSNNLGIDQKLLRLRYGKFLGEEAESNIGDPRAAGEADSYNPADFGNAAKILDTYTDKHDNAEDAGFFEPETKKQLKATLTEMWNAELRLRTFKPQEALPFAYKALRLLKDLQQKSRAYVAKTGAKTPPLKQEKRLSGDLSKIISPSARQQFQPASAEITRLRSALGMLQQLKAGAAVNTNNVSLLQQATAALGKEAAHAPARYLAAYEAAQRITEKIQRQQPFSNQDMNAVSSALQQLLSAPASTPAANSTTGNSLSQQYFHQLNQSRKP